MRIDKATLEAVAGQERIKSILKRKLIACSILALFSFFAILASVASQDSAPTSNILNIALVLVIVFSFIMLAVSYSKYEEVAGLLSGYRLLVSEIHVAERQCRSVELKQALKRAKVASFENPLLATLLLGGAAQLLLSIDLFFRREQQQKLEEEYKHFTNTYKSKIKDALNEHPLYQALRALETSITYLKDRRVSIVAQWKAAYDKFSWYNKLKYGDTPDLKELDNTISNLEAARFRLLKTQEEKFLIVNAHYDKLMGLTCERAIYAKEKAEQYIRTAHSEDRIGQGLLQKGFWLALLSVPVSLWSDASRANDVYDALRSVHGGFANMSNVEIWWETLLMPTESLVGLASLTKGAYLEHLIAKDTGGELFEHFNHPDTDIVIDGIAFQIKATDNTAYIDGVADGIPIIATSEIAEYTGNIDSGYSNEELSDSVGLALGGTVVDLGDTTADAILAGVGGLGIFASLHGIRHAVTKIENGGEGLEACFEGAGIAIEGTARAAVNAMELGYNVLNSRPFRFVGRVLYSGLVKLDNKLMAPVEKTDRRRR